MYKNRISRPTPNQQPQFFIRRSEIEFDERARYVEFVCAVWNEGRFGPDLADPVIIDWSDRPEPGAAVFYDLCDDEPNRLTPFNALSPLGRAGYQVVEAAYRRAKQMGLSDAGSNVRNPASALMTNQGRGSP